MIGKIIDKATSKHYQWGEQCDAWTFVDMQDLSVKLESMPPSTKENLHFHNKASQFFFILQGTATFYLDSEVVSIREQQGFFIDADLKHYIANKSDHLLSFLVISQPSTNLDRINV